MVCGIDEFKNWDVLQHYEFKYCDVVGDEEFKNQDVVQHFMGSTTLYWFIQRSSNITTTDDEGLFRQCLPEDERQILKQ